MDKRGQVHSSIATEHGGEPEIGRKLFGMPNRPSNQVDNTERIHIMNGHDKGRFAEFVFDLESCFINQCSAQAKRPGAFSNPLAVDTLAVEDEVELLMRLRGV